MRKLESKLYKLKSGLEFSVYEKNINKPWVIFIHGLQTSKILFESWLEDSFFESNSLLAVDLIGFGDSQKNEEFDYSVESHALAVLELLQYLEIDKCFYIGHSLGGMIGAFLLKSHHKMFYSMVSMEGNLQLDDCGESVKVASLQFDDFSQNRFPKLLRQLEESTLPSASIRYKSVSKVPDYVFFKTSQGIVQTSKGKQLYSIFENTECPKLLIIGSSSGYISRPSSDFTKYSLIQDATHFMSLDKPEETFSHLKEFLTSTGVE